MRSTALLDIDSEVRYDIRDVERLVSVATAAAAIAYGVSRRSVPGICLAAAATPFAYRGLVGTWPRLNHDRPTNGSTRVALGGSRGIHVRESIRLEKPLDEVYRFWRRFENLPRFMTHLERVVDLGQGRSHWVAKGRAGVNVEWDAEIINEVENKVIGWRSLPGSAVVTAGSVNFDRVRNGQTTQVSVHLQYALPGGRATALLATFLGREPSQTIREDLRRLKWLLEAGEVPRGKPERTEEAR
jgi:uncharacterized membrane protein